MVFIPVQDDNRLKSIRFQWVTIGLIAVNVLAFLWQATLVDGRIAASFAVVPAELLRMGVLGGPALGPLDALPIPERYTLLGYMFLHGDLVHLGSNMLFLWVFGDNIEDGVGHVRFLLFYLACGIVAALTHTLMMPNSTVPLIGASGAVAGVIGAYLMLHPRVRVWVLAFRIIPLRIPAAFVIGAWIITQITMVLLPQSTNTAWWAHIGGLVAGAVLIVVLRRPGLPLLDGLWAQGRSG
jgi:membrane associated rhomboid family serine protease